MIPDPVKVHILLYCDSVNEMRKVVDGLRDWMRVKNPGKTVAVLNGTIIYAGEEMVEVIHREKLAAKKQGAHWDHIAPGSEVWKRLEYAFKELERK